MYDDYLARSENDRNLREQLDENLHGTKVIPPFCLKTKLPDKGGTASIYWVAVQKDLISDNALALALKDSIYTDEDFGEVSFLTTLVNIS